MNIIHFLFCVCFICCSSFFDQFFLLFGYSFLFYGVNYVYGETIFLGYVEYFFPFFLFCTFYINRMPTLPITDQAKKLQLHLREQEVVGRQIWRVWGVVQCCNLFLSQKLSNYRCRMRRVIVVQEEKITSAVQEGTNSSNARN